MRDKDREEILAEHWEYRSILKKSACPYCAQRFFDVMEDHDLIRCAVLHGKTENIPPLVVEDKRQEIDADNARIEYRRWCYAHGFLLPFETPEFP